MANLICQIDLFIPLFVVDLIRWIGPTGIYNMAVPSLASAVREAVRGNTTSANL